MKFYFFVQITTARSYAYYAKPIKIYILLHVLIVQLCEFLVSPKRFFSVICILF